MRVHSLPGFEDARISARVRKENTKRAFPIQQGADGLTEWCRNRMLRTAGPRSARNLVDSWYLHWRGQPDKPEKVKRKHKTHHVDRVAKWLKRQHERGLLAVYDEKGRWGAKRYVTVPLPPVTAQEAGSPRPKRLRKSPTPIVEKPSGTVGHK